MLARSRHLRASLLGQTVVQVEPDPEDTARMEARRDALAKRFGITSEPVFMAW